MKISSTDLNILTDLFSDMQTVFGDGISTKKIRKAIKDIFHDNTLEELEESVSEENSFHVLTVLMKYGYKPKFLTGELDYTSNDFDYGYGIKHTEEEDKIFKFLENKQFLIQMIDNKVIYCENFDALLDAIFVYNSNFVDILIVPKDDTLTVMNSKSSITLNYRIITDESLVVAMSAITSHGQYPLTIEQKNSLMFGDNQKYFLN